MMLEIRNLFFGLGGTSILNGVSLDISQGETAGVIGPNGSGKTTLFNCISGFCLPDSGSIRFQGRDITHLDPFERAGLGLGRVFQDSGVFREMTVRENMLAALESRQSILGMLWPWGKQNAANRELADQHLREVGLAARAGEKAGSLSGGQMRLLEIARALAFGAELFLLDEPTAGVSPRMKDDVATLIRKLQSLKKTVLIIEHDINFIQKFCERIIVLDLGRVVLDDTPESVREDELLQEIYFGNGNGTEEAAMDSA